MKSTKEKVEKQEGYFVYILRCGDGSLYTGWTTELERRLEQHNSGIGAKYTRGRGPVKMVYSEEVAGKSEALKRECQIKKYSKLKKEKLIGGKSEELVGK